MFSDRTLRLAGCRYIKDRRVGDTTPQAMDVQFIAGAKQRSLISRKPSAVRGSAVAIGKRRRQIVATISFDVELPKHDVAVSSIGSDAGTIRTPSHRPRDIKTSCRSSGAPARRYRAARIGSGPLLNGRPPRP